MNEDEKKIYKDRASAKVKELHAARKKLQPASSPPASKCEPDTASESAEANVQCDLPPALHWHTGRALTCVRVLGQGSWGKVCKAVSCR